MAFGVRGVHACHGQGKRAKGKVQREIDPGIDEERRSRKLRRWQSTIGAAREPECDASRQQYRQNRIEEPACKWPNRSSVVDEGPNGFASDRHERNWQGDEEGPPPTGCYCDQRDEGDDKTRIVERIRPGDGREFTNDEQRAMNRNERPLERGRPGDAKNDSA
jgi:hypothetical protein